MRWLASIPAAFISASRVVIALAMLSDIWLYRKPHLSLITEQSGLSTGLLLATFIGVSLLAALWAWGIQPLISGALLWVLWLFICTHSSGLNYGFHEVLIFFLPVLLLLPATPLHRLRADGTRLYTSPALLLIQILLAYFYIKNGFVKIISEAFSADLLSTFVAKDNVFTQWLAARPEWAEAAFQGVAWLELIGGFMLLIPDRIRLLGATSLLILHPIIALSFEVGFFPLLNFGLLLLTFTGIEFKSSGKHEPLRASRWAWGGTALISVVILISWNKPLGTVATYTGMRPLTAYYARAPESFELELIAKTSDGTPHIISSTKDDSMPFPHIQLLGMPLAREDSTDKITRHLRTLTEDLSLPPDTTTLILLKQSDSGNTLITQLSKDSP